MTMLNVVWALGVLVALCAGWFASGLVHQRRIELLALQLREVRLSANEHAAAARHQIGLLQADLARRPPAPRADQAPMAQDNSQTDRVADRFMRDEDGFAKTMIDPARFAPAELTA